MSEALFFGRCTAGTGDLMALYGPSPVPSWPAKRGAGFRGLGKRSRRPGKDGFFAAGYFGLRALLRLGTSTRAP